MSSPPLQGLQVLDLSKVLAGPLCAQYLGDIGTEVIKVEIPDAGDETRHWPHLRELEGTRVGAAFLSANGNKSSLVIALTCKVPKGARQSRSWRQAATSSSQDEWRQGGSGTAGRLATHTP
jgi:crotonobetainyl-CoA:carnitine CoA-transferase CaiB-like acyl-CoA transferase